MRRPGRLLCAVLLLLLLSACVSAPTTSPTPTHPPVATLSSGQAAPTLSPTISAPGAPLPTLPGASPPAASADLEALFEAILRDLLTRDPQWLTSTGLNARYDHAANSRLTDISPPFRAQTQALIATYLAQLQAIDPTPLKSDQRLAWQVMLWYLTDYQRSAAFANDDFILNPVSGVESGLNILLTNDHPLQTWQDAQAYVARLAAIDTQFDQALDNLTLSEQGGIIPSQAALNFALGRLRGAIQPPPTQHPYLTRLSDALDRLTPVDASTRAELLQTAADVMQQSVYPAYRRLIDRLEGWQGQASLLPGVWQHPDGAAYYAAMLRHHTSSDLSAAEIHALGLTEVARLQAELQALFDQAGYPPDTLRHHFDRAARAGGFMPSTTAAERERVVAEYSRLIQTAETAVAPLFDRTPHVRLTVAYEIGQGAAYYLSPALNGGRGGVFMAQLGGDMQARYAMPTLAYHEGIPGHHFQIGLQGELEDLRLFQRLFNFTAYAEGWALYAERLAWEAGLYSEDAPGNIGRIQMELFRAARLVVDTGLHDQRWSRQQAIDYLVENTGLPPARMTWEVDRYISWPGQACAYTLGELKILELRELAQRELGARFDIRAFHSAIQEHGPLPLSLLEQVVQTYIAEASHSPSTP